MFSAWDNQYGTFLCTGSNAKTKEECIDDVYEYLMSDSEENVHTISGVNKEDFILSAGIEIIEHEEVIDGMLD